MGFFQTILGAGIVITGYKKIKRKIDQINDEALEVTFKRAEEERKRTSTICNFDRGISKDEFYEMVKRAGKGIKRLTKLYADDTVVHGKFLSQSGINEWYFTIDFNDYGKLTGSYWLSTNNKDSNLPDVVGQRIAKQIENHPSMEDEYVDDEPIYDEVYDIEQEPNQDSPKDCSCDREAIYEEVSYKEDHRNNLYCRYCGKQIYDADANYCVYCGKQLER